MEGKAVLFKRFADVDAFDIEIDEQDPARLADHVCALAPTFGGINLEDIRAPDCFFVEEECKRRCDIPIFHDDQHGTAIVAGAALLNALELVGKRIERGRAWSSRAQAPRASPARSSSCSSASGARTWCSRDIDGVVYRGRGDGNYLDELAARHAGADVGRGARGCGRLRRRLRAGHRDAGDAARRWPRARSSSRMANPVPEIDYRLARANAERRRDGDRAQRLSEPGQQRDRVPAHLPRCARHALPHDQRGDEACRFACRSPRSRARARRDHTLGRDYVIPKPFDVRLLPRVARAVAEAAMRTGAARVEVDPAEYERRLEQVAERIAM